MVVGFEAGGTTNSFFTNVDWAAGAGAASTAGFGWAFFSCCCFQAGTAGEADGAVSVLGLATFFTPSEEGAGLTPNEGFLDRPGAAGPAGSDDPAGRVDDLGFDGAESLEDDEEVAGGGDAEGFEGTEGLVDTAGLVAVGGLEASAASGLRSTWGLALVGGGSFFGADAVDGDTGELVCATVGFVATEGFGAGEASAGPP